MWRGALVPSVSNLPVVRWYITLSSVHIIFQISCDCSCPIKLLLMYIGDVIANYYLDMFLIIFSLEITISRAIQAEGHL